jgi:hypothetical protein
MQDVFTKLDAIHERQSHKAEMTQGFGAKTPDRDRAGETGRQRGCLLMLTSVVPYISNDVALRLFVVHSRSSASPRHSH